MTEKELETRRKNAKNIRDRHAKTRIGETRIMSNGMKATIIEYISCMNITVQLENGQIVENRRYEKFCIGAIDSPMVYTPIDNYIKCENPNTGTVFLIDAEDYDKVKGCHWYNGSGGYAMNNYKGKFHILIMNPPKGMVIDHINGDKLDNRKCNLRICTTAENVHNQKRRITNKSGYKGVYYNKYTKKWIARITSNYKYISLGCFTTPEAAHAAYCEAAKRLHGEFARFA